MPANRLQFEKSPYLLQHAQNPVDWYPWGDEAFEKARTEDKPIFLSIGYSTCHWCHVMEHESFESDDVAALLNRAFVPIKVDREERPDVDRIYMTFVQATTGSGGWPLSVWLTPELQPFYGGTYFPPDNRYGRPGFPALLTRLASAWMTDRTRVTVSSSEIVAQMKEATNVAGQGQSLSEEDVRQRTFQHYRRSFDTRRGGFGDAPKFPRPVSLNFLLREGVWSKNDEAREMALTTLRAMSRGGMNDQLGGGFHRYSVDADWFVPHFEKMLYDQAQLATSYLEAFQISQEEQFAETARATLDYVRRDLTHPEGGFYSAEDADSVIDAADPKKKGEGAFYIWSYEELETLLGADFSWFARRYGVKRGGNVEHDPHNEFTGRNILFLADDTSGDRDRLEKVREKLLAARSTRVRPHLDDKVLTSWNGLMISAFAKAAQVLGDATYRDAAVRAAEFIRSRMLLPDGTLLRRFCGGEAAIPGFLDDYALFAQALLDLHETTFDEEYLALAQQLTQAMKTRFEDFEKGGFYSTPEGAEDLILRLKEDYDGAEPAGNSIAILNLLRLGQIDTATRALEAFGSRMLSQPTSVPQMVIALAVSQRPVQQVVIAGDPQEAAPLIQAAHRMFAPFRLLLLNPTGRSEFQAVSGKPAAYVCQDFACQMPVSNADDLIRLLS